MHCQFCGTALQSGAVACPSCGTRVTSASSEFASYESSDETAASLPYTPAGDTSSVSSRQQTTPHSQLAPHPPSADPPLYLGAPPFPGAIQEPPFGQQQRGGLPAGMTALLVILAVLVGAVGSGLTYYMLALRPAQHQAQTTALAPTVSTTPTAASSPQTTPLTATNPQDLYTQATSGTPALLDPLSPQNPNQWSPIGRSPGSCTFSGSALHVSASPTGSKNTSSVCVARSTSFDNFAFQARATILQGDICALVFRYDSFSYKEYLFIINSEGIYDLFAGQGNSLGGSNVRVLAGENSSAINIGLNQPNLLTVIARGSMIYLYVNQQYLTSVSDSTSSSGEIGVAADNTSGGPLDVAFSEIQVWRL